ncbi:YjbF family lipoprotein [Alteromonas sp. 1_MG-2023]|uniref:YjbF family lipoprotein n=1 Tax=Alteromonas sp. 1_MG-2023 TaxID=3062669 RepID=UPI0026E2A1B8|nr:YjbF family lipoprotein [Alteromonas sp. 1_MG-2023]MDO6566462.1 YjbF family lipoprotein [Alteromonas sp. 1_MG-2023]
MKSSLLLISISLLSLLVTGCSSTIQSYVKTINLALEDRTVSYTVDEIEASKADLLQIKAGGRDAASLALAYIDGDKYRWVSGDKVIFTMHHGVIIQSEGLDNELYYTGNLKHNPLASNDILPYSWARKLDLENVGYGLPISSTWRVQGEESRTYLGATFTVTKITESVIFPETTPFIDTSLEWENTYYLDAKSKQLLASNQKLSPQGDVYEMVYLSRIVRLMKSKDL